MAGVQRFEDLVAWQKARVLVRHVYTLSADGPMSRDYGFRNQLRRAALSIMNNIAEGYGRRGDKEFSQFLRVAKGSAAEVQSMLYIGLDADYLTETEFEALNKEVRETAAVISGLLEYLSKGKSPERQNKPDRTPPPTSDFRPSTN